MSNAADRGSSDAWRQFILTELVQFLDQNRDLILERYQQTTESPIPRDRLEQEGLMDFELALTFLKDKQGWGQGKGFLGMNLIG